MPTLNIRVGASVDRSLNMAFAPLEASAKRAKATVSSELTKTSRTISTEVKKGTKDAEARFRELELEITHGMPRATSVGVAAVKSFAKETTTSFAVTKRNFQDLAREAESAMGRINKVQRSQGGNASMVYNMFGGTKGVQAGLSRSGRMALGIGRAATGAAYRLGMSYMHGIGVDTDMSSIFHKNTELEASATALSNAGVVKEDPRNRERIDPRILMEQAFKTAKANGTDVNATMEGLRHFTDITGDLATGRAVIGDIENTAKATGTSMEDMIAAAGEMSRALGPAENKAAALSKLMNQFAAQGERGGTAIRLLAPHMAKIAASATMFEGDTADNIALMGFLAGNEGRKGGAANAAQTSTAAQGMVNTLGTKARNTAFTKWTHGKSVYGKSGKLRNMQDLILESIEATGTDTNAFNSIWGNQKGRQGPQGVRLAYLNAGGGEAGMKAAKDEIERGKKASIDAEQIAVSFAAAMETSESQANILNASLREVALRLQNDLLPAVMALTPQFVNLASGMANVLGWLIGKDAATRNQVLKSKGEVDTTIADTKKQMDQGIYMKGQEVLTARAERNARDALIAAGGEYTDSKGRIVKGHGELDKARENRTGSFGRGLGTIADWTVPGRVAKLVGKMAGQDDFSFGGKFKAEDEDIKTKEDQVRAAQETFDRIHALNAELNAKILNGTLDVRVVEDNSKEGKPPEGHEDGRQNPPGGEE